MTVVLLGGSWLEAGVVIVAFGSGESPPVPPVRRPLVAKDDTWTTVVTDSIMVELLQAEVGNGSGKPLPVPVPDAPLTSPLVAVETAVPPIHVDWLEPGSGLPPPVPLAHPPLAAPEETKTADEASTMVLPLDATELGAGGNGPPLPQPVPVAPLVAPEDTSTTVVPQTLVEFHAHEERLASPVGLGDGLPGRGLPLPQPELVAPLVAPDDTTTSVEPRTVVEFSAKNEDAPPVGAAGDEAGIGLPAPQPLPEAPLAAPELAGTAVDRKISVELAGMGDAPPVPVAVAVLAAPPVLLAAWPGTALLPTADPPPDPPPPLPLPMALAYWNILVVS